MHRAFSDLNNFKEKYKIYIWYIFGAAAIIILYVWFQGTFFGEERQIRKFVLRGKGAVESKNIFTCADMISTSYDDKYGNSRQDLIYIANNVFGYYREISVYIEDVDIKLDDSKEQSSVEIAARVIGRTEQDNMEKILEGDKGGLRIKIVKENTKWKLSKLEFLESITIMGRTISWTE